MMMTPGAAILTAILTRIGAVPYAVANGRSHTKKVARYSLPNGNPLVLEVDRKVPNLWMRPEHERGVFHKLGETELYAPGRGRHSNLRQIREFAGRELVKISLPRMNWPDIEAALGIVAGVR